MHGRTDIKYRVLKKIAKYLDIVLNQSGIVIDLRSHLSLVLSNGNSISPQIEQRLLIFMRKFKTWKSSSLSIIHVGSKNDGGYVINKQENIDILLTAGVGDDISFEKEINKIYPYCNIILLDHTINKLPTQLKNSTFIKKGLGPYRNENHLTLSDLFIDFELGRSKSPVLKIDIEGNEYNFLKDVDGEQLNKFDQLIIELHNLDWVVDDNKSQLLEKSVSNLLVNFKPIFVKVNNYGGFFPCGANFFPKVIELTLVNNRFMKNAEQDISVLEQFHMLNNPYGLNYNLSELFK